MWIFLMYYFAHLLHCLPGKISFIFMASISTYKLIFPNAASPSFSLELQTSAAYSVSPLEHPILNSNWKRECVWVWTHHIPRTICFFCNLYNHHLPICFKARSLKVNLELHPSSESPEVLCHIHYTASCMAKRRITSGGEKNSSSERQFLKDRILPCHPDSLWWTWVKGSKTCHPEMCHFGIRIIWAKGNWEEADTRKFSALLLFAWNQDINL